MSIKWNKDYPKATKACISHFVRKAVKDKQTAIDKVSNPESMKRDCGYMQDVYRNNAQKSVKAIARERLNYMRYRACLSARGGSYAPEGWPLDRPAREQWQALNV